MKKNINTFKSLYNFLKLVPFAFILSATAQAEIYVYKNVQGQTVYSDHPVSYSGYYLMKMPEKYHSNTSRKNQTLITRINRYSKQNQSKRLLKYPKNHQRFDHVIQQAARSFSVDPALIKAVIHAESSFNPNAVSRVGAQGLMQLMPATAGMYEVSDPYNPRQNIMAGSKHLRYLLDKYNHKHNQIELALAAYNAGEGRVRKYKGIPPYPETQNYVKKVKRLKVDYYGHIGFHL